MSHEAPQIPARQLARTVGVALRRDVPAIALAAGVTVAVQLTVWAVARATLSPARSSVATVLLAGLWVFVAGPVFAAAAPAPLGGLFRGGAVIDASGVVLVVLAVTDSPPGWVGAVEVYLVFAAVGLAQCALVRAAGSARGRLGLAAAAVLGLLVISAGPFWANGAIMAAPQPWSGRIAYAVVAANPAFACAGALAEAGFLWQESPILYEFTVLGRDAPMPTPPWYVTALAYALLAGLLAAAAAARRGRATASL